MRIREDNFKGRIPKLSDRALPVGNATTAHNCRLRTGDVEPYKGSVKQFDLQKPGPISTIFPTDRDGSSGGPYWYSWTESETNPTTKTVDAVRVPILVDRQELTLFTGAADRPDSSDPRTDYRPKITNLKYGVTDGPGMSNAYPYSWFYLGVPAPTMALTVDQQLPSTYVFNPVGTGGDLIGYIVSTQTAKSTVISDPDTGNPAPSFRLRSEHLTAPVTHDPCFLYRDFGATNTGPGGIKFDLTTKPATAGVTEAIMFTLGATQTGRGFTVKFIVGNPTGDPTDPVIAVGTKSSWDSDLSITSSYNQIDDGIILSHSTNYSVQFDYIPIDGDLTQNFVTMTIMRLGMTPVLVAKIGFNITSNGGYAGWSVYGGQSASTFQGNIDNVQQASLQNTPGIQATSWVITYVNQLGQEGPPSPATGTFFVGESIRTDLSNFSQSPPAGYGVASINIYRAVTGSVSTQYQFEANVPLTTTVYSSTKTDAQLGEILATTEYDLPPQDGINVVALPNGITLMSSGNNVCPSVAYQCHAYPQDYRLATELPIVAMVAIETTLVVLTLDSAYLVVGSDPSALSMSKIGPQYGCVSKESAVRWDNFGVVYASSEGLVLVNGGGSRILTQEYITLREWNSLFFPSTIKASIHENMYYALYKQNGTQKAFIFDTRDDGIGFIDIDLVGNAIYSEHNREELYHTIGNGLYKWDVGDNLTYTWKSKLYEMPYPTSFNGAQIRTVDTQLTPTPVTLNLYKDGESVPYFTKTLMSKKAGLKEFVIKSDVCFNHQLEIIGQSKVSRITVSEGIEEID